MSIANISFDDIAEGHVLEQIQAGIPEGILVDYKESLYGGSDADVKEFLKDVSSFANTAGGHLFTGVKEDEGLPTEPSPLAINPDEQLQRLENLVRDGIEPRIVGLRMKAIQMTDGGHVILLRVPKSFNPPHRVSARNTNRIYGRNSAGAYEYSIDELRVVFTSAANALDRVRAFRFERLAKVDSGDGVASLANKSGRLVLHLVPISSFGVSGQIDLGRARALQEFLRPMNAMGYTPQINFDGLANLSFDSDRKCRSYTQIFRTGAIEAVVVPIVKLFEGQPVIPAKAFGDYVFEVLPMYLKALQQLDVPPPIVFMLSLQGIRGARLGVSIHSLSHRTTIDRAVLELPEIMIEQYSAFPDYQRAVRPAFDTLWNAGGLAQSSFFNESGLWNPPA
jgi:hypothetical protein